MFPSSCGRSDECGRQASLHVRIVACPRYHVQELRPRAGVSLIASTSPRETQAQAAKLHRRTVTRHKCEEDAIALLILCKGVSWSGTQMSDLYMEQRCE